MSAEKGSKHGLKRRGTGSEFDEKQASPPGTFTVLPQNYPWESKNYNSCLLFNFKFQVANLLDI